MQNPETRVMNAIRIYCGEHNVLCFHCNVGGGMLANGSFFSTGLPNGFPDLICIGNGKIWFCECKFGKGKLRPDQVQFIKTLKEHNINVCVAYTLQEFIDYTTQYNLI